MATKPTSNSELDFKEIQELVRMVTKSEIMELEIERKDFRIKISKGGGMISAPQVYQPQAQISAPSQQTVLNGPVSETTTSKPVAEEEGENLYTFKSPMIGTFYRTPSPEKDVFVKVGDSISVGNVLCIIEAMKLFNEIESDVAGKIVKILVENGKPVEYDQPLFLIQKD